MKSLLFEDVLILSAAKALRALVRRLPPAFSLWAARGIGALAFMASKRRRIAHQNLRAAFAGEKSNAELRRIARCSAQNLAMAVVEILRFPEVNRGYIDEHFCIEGMPYFEPVMREGRGIIFLAGHFGN